MAHNPNTRLLLKFGEGAGSTGTNDTSVYGRYATIDGGEVTDEAGVFGTNGVVIGDPFGAGSAGCVTVWSPETLFSDSSSSTKRIDQWFRVEAFPPWGNSPLFSLTFGNGDTFTAWYSNVLLEIEYNGTQNDPTHYIYGSASFYPAVTQWYHFRCVIQGNSIHVGLDGSEVLSTTHSADIWTGTPGNSIVECRLGSWPSAYGADANVFLRGYIDAVEFLDGDSSWAGGTYTIPNHEPDDYGVDSGPELFAGSEVTLNDLTGEGSASTGGVEGVGSSQLENTVSVGEALVVDDRLANGGNALDPVTSSGSATVVTPMLAAGSNTLEAVGSVGVAGGSDDIYTTLALNGTIVAGKLRDSSLYRHDIPAAGVTAGAPIFSGPSLFFETGIYAEVKQPAFVLSSPVDKRLGFFYQDSGSSGRTEILWAQFSDGSSISILNNFGQLALDVVTPSISVIEYGGMASFPSNTTHHIQLAIIADKVHLGVDGVEVLTRTGSGRVWPEAGVTRFCIGSPVSSRFTLDGLTIREGDIGFAGGNYTVPSAEWWPAIAYADGANTVANVSSAANSLLEKLASGANTIDPISSSGNVIGANLAIGDSTLDEVVSAGEASALGSPAMGANTVDPISSSGSADVLAVLGSSGAVVVDDVVSLCQAHLSWLARGANAVEAIASIGNALAPSVLECIGAGVVDDVVSFGWADFSLPATGTNTVEPVASTGEAWSMLVVANGNSRVDDMAVAGVVEKGRLANGRRTVVAVSSSGSAITEIFSQGSVALADIGSHGTGLVRTILSADGSSVAEVMSVGEARAVAHGIGESVVDDVVTLHSIFAAGNLMLDDVSSSSFERYAGPSCFVKTLLSSAYIRSTTTSQVIVQ